MSHLAQFPYQLNNENEREMDTFFTKIKKDEI
jgi:hypothetical protein